ncbi:peptide-methionine (R)-S-oxide reductase MsrB [Palleronia sp. LCG004]|uniref:peptide-methionine (R)-S-oxide reductase MsrB n=1 Tax=Palleronia sp. LCG004 TaxID=3079304 RepID=UPI0029422624|nr:peptide-methionine (R)-S-oxide reductase MsrB [Palleronia sp. LCG004]WOI55304.1 peptide-methionine (R)-S-oxide reductase MsrB [Palleronia sp. LCG004]
MRRRHFLACSAAAFTAPTFLSAAEGETFEVTHSPEEWRRMLGDAAYDVMREEGTERPNSSPLNAVKADGTFHCKGCDQALYPSKTKFESGTGWPSFYAPVEDAVATKPDPGWFGMRTEVHCDRCGSHMGHVFDDGPEPTGKRHCINGIAMVFRPAGSGEPVIG